MKSKQTKERVKLNIADYQAGTSLILNSKALGIFIRIIPDMSLMRHKTIWKHSRRHFESFT